MKVTANRNIVSTLTTMNVKLVVTNEYLTGQFKNDIATIKQLETKSKSSGGGGSGGDGGGGGRKKKRVNRGQDRSQGIFLELWV